MTTINWIADIIMALTIPFSIWGLILKVKDYYRSKKWEKQQKKTD